MKDFQQVTYRVTDCYLKDRRHLVDPGLWKKLNGFCRSRNLRKLASAGDLFDPALHGSSEMSTLLQVEAFFKKSSAFTGSDSRTTAHASFVDAEKKCRITNRRIDFYATHPQRMNSEMRKRIEAARRFIARTLGDFRTFRARLPDYVKITSGASAESSRRESMPYLKVGSRITYTPKAKVYLDALYEHFGYPFRGKCIQANRLTFVPKSWKTDRTIACEPVGNLSLQLAFDAFCKERLRKEGIDLSDQTRNQGLSIQGSINGSYATIDLKAASDTLSLIHI